MNALTVIILLSIPSTILLISSIIRYVLMTKRENKHLSKDIDSGLNLDEIGLREEINNITK